MRPVDDLIRKYYSDVPMGERVLADLVQEVISQKRFPILDAGCGRKAKYLRRFGPEAQLVGIDLSPQLPKDLPVVRGDLVSLPFRDNSFYFVFSRSVFEHLPKPDEVLNEFHRVLKPGGRCAIVTPNRYDYSSLVAWVTPQTFHEYFIRNLYRLGAYDSFPVFYRANTPRYFEKLALEKRKWTIVRISGLRHYPANLSFSRILFRIGILYDKLLAKMNCVSLQPSLLVVLEKATPLSEETAADEHVLDDKGISQSASVWTQKT